MAVGGALRAALKAADWTKAARESRRRARALAELNARGGISNASLNRRGSGFLPDGGPYNDSYEGVDPFRGLDWDDRLHNFGAVYGEGISPRGAYVQEVPEGALGRYGSRTLFSPDFGPGMRPIEAPYEGFRVWPYGSRPAFDEPAWIGAGAPYRAPGVNVEFYDDGLGSPRSYDYGAMDFRPYNPMPIAEMNVPRAFGGFDPFYSNNPAAISRSGRIIPFEEIMAARGSLFPPPFKPMRPEDVPF